MRRHHNQQCHEVVHVFSQLFVAGGLNPCFVPEGCIAVLRVFDIVPGCTDRFTDHTFTSRAEFVETLLELRQGARGVCLETEERARQLAEEHAQSLASGGACRLMPGARGYELAKVDTTTGARTVLCGRAGPHSPLLAQAVGAKLPLQPQPLQAAQTERQKEAAVKLLHTRSAEAQHELVKAAAAAAVGTAEAAAALIEVSEKRGTQLDVFLQPEIERRSAQLREAGLGDQAASFLAARLELTKHCVRPDVKGGMK